MLKRLLCICSAFLLLACSSKEILLRDLNERDANEIIAVLNLYQIKSEKAADTKGKSFSVSVNNSELANAVSVLKANGLPRENRPSLNEIFKPSGFAPTPFEERVRFIYGVSQELERTIALIHGVLNVRVHIVLPEKASRREVPKIPSASVFINYDDQQPVAEQASSIRRLVAESIEGLSEDHVEVVMVPVTVNFNKRIPGK